MKRTADLSSRELDHYVALALGAEMTRDTLANEDKTGFRLSYREHGKPPGFYLVDPSGIVSPWNPSVNWWICGRIIERTLTSIEPHGRQDGVWVANRLPDKYDPGWSSEECPWTGSTPLIAITRAVVADKFGEEVLDGPN